MTTPTSRRRDVRASTATAPAADEERGAQLSPALAKKREDGCRLLLLRYTSGRQPPSNHLGCAVSLSRVSPPRGEFSPATPRGNHPRDLFPSLVHQRCLFPSRTAVFIPLVVSPSLSLNGRTKPPVHHRRHYPTTEFSATNTPLGPLTLRRAPSRARYQPAAIPTATTESRDRPRVVGSPPVSHPTRRHATPRRAQRVFLCIAFQKPASVRSLIARPSYRKSSARRNLARLRTRATPKGSLNHRTSLRHGDRQYRAGYHRDRDRKRKGESTTCQGREGG